MKGEMSFYNMLHGENSKADMLLAILGTSKSAIPRYRDCYLSDGKIIIHTRTGGGNRDCYDAPNEDNEEGPWNSDLRSLPGYLRDEDDDFDSTYADFYFEPRWEFKELVNSYDDDTPPAEKWQTVLGKLRDGNKDDPEVAKILEKMTPLMDGLNKVIESGESGVVTV